MLKQLLIFVLLMSTVSRSSDQVVSENTGRAFQKLRALVGTWEGTDGQGGVVRSKFESVASGTAVLETLSMSGMDEMLTVYTVDKETIALMHYCPTNNQPQMRAIPPAGVIKELSFEFQRAGNLPDLNVGHEHKLVLQFKDEDHIVERWTWRKNGRDSEMVYRLVRRSAGAVSCRRLIDLHPWAETRSRLPLASLP